MRVFAVVLCLLSAVPLHADDLTGIWRIDRLGALDLSGLSEPGRHEVTVEGGRFLARLACAYVEGEVTEAGLSREGVTGDWLKCPAEERAAAERLIGVLTDPGRVAFLVGDTLTLRASDGGSTVWTRLPGSSGPSEALQGILGEWRIAAVDGEAPLPGIETDRPPVVVVDRFRIGGNAGCNGGGADILWREDGFVSRGPVVSTAMLCEPLMAQEFAVFGVFAGPSQVERTAEGWRLTGETGTTVDLVAMP